MLAGMNAPRTGIPLRADPHAVRDDAVRSLVRAAIVVGRAVFDHNEPRKVEDFVRQKGWADDRAAGILTRAASGPALTSQAGWAKELATVAQAFLRTLVPMSAAAQLLDQAIALSFNGTAKITLPTITPGSASWVAEGQPIGVSQMPTGAGPSLEPYKLASIVVLSREMLESSNAEAIVRQALVDSTAPALDIALFSNVAGVAGLYPAGILNGVTGLTASTNTDKTAAMDDDLSALVEEIAPRAGNSSIAFVAAPAQATRIALRAQQTPGPVLMSATLSPKTVIAVATSALVAAIEPPTLDAGREASLHFDTSPDEIVTAAGTVARPVGSLFQTDSVALRLRMPASWILRASGAVALVTNTGW